MSHLSLSNKNKILKLLLMIFIISNIITLISYHNTIVKNKKYTIYCDSLMRFSDRVIDNNALWRTDNSIEMKKYIHYHTIIDNINAKE